MRRFYVCSALSLVVLGLAACSGQSPAADTAPSTEDVTEQSELQARFTVETVGSGPDIILIPGLASHPETFETTVAQLEDRFTLHLVHVAGFAGAEPAGNADEDDILLPLAKEVAAYASSLDQPPSVIGHSLGGLTAMSAALADRDAFERVMVIDVLPFFSVLIDPEASEESIVPTAAFLRATLLNQPDEVYQIRQREALDALTKSDEALEKSVEWSLTTDRAVMAEAMHDVLTTDLRDEMAEMPVPLTVLYARDDAIPNMERVEEQFLSGYAPVPDATIIAVDGALHFIMYDQPELYGEAVEAFVSEISGD
ncbi:MAG: alpha/beta hydrolase [Pseudomonadota bacterium]